jgi:hypothetical protein
MPQAVVRATVQADLDRLGGGGATVPVG